MIEINALNDSDVGRWVEYCPRVGDREKGRIKSWNDKFVFVVYNCDDNWGDYQNYTAAATYPNALSFQKKGNQKMNGTEAKIIELLRSTGRDGIESLIGYLKADGFFESPASTKFHGCYPGGLAKHSLGVYELLAEFVGKLNLSEATSPGQKPLPIEPANIIIAGLLHDVCKMGAYLGSEKPYKWNKEQPKGHATLSIERIKKNIELTAIEEMMIRYHMGEEMMIRYHMGVYGLNEFYEKGSWEFKTSAEYPLRGDHSKDKDMTKEESQAARYGQSLRNAWYHNPIIKVMYFCDELQVLTEKAED